MGDTLGRSGRRSPAARRPARPSFARDAMGRNASSRAARRKAPAGEALPAAATTPVLVRGAVFDGSGRYRYTLTRRWAPGGTGVTFVLLNPSTADAERDDPTLRRCMGFARAWGHAALEVVNLFAWRATRPADLRRAGAPVGAANDAYLLAAAQRAERVVLAWGSHGMLAGRAAAVRALLARAVPRLECLGLTQGGQPRHVLYLPRTVRPVPYPPDAGEASGAAARRRAAPRTAAPSGRARRPALR